MTAQAGRLGIPVEDYALHLLTSGAPAASRTGAELVSYWHREGLIGTRPDVTDIQEHARQLRSRARSGLDGE